eukprot:CAMPEP_0182441164 /NCGR_PEP_ID=MMETSP1172-20130603/116_1 /TAXON_ID=708627 /ORGANISM="Timspurckia oligopyrenoides, Strain CCMP3278" /LENGTH=192 /DNA_ID=CAMNT_0024635327 /DNA_START=209 /DNA_END=787 /DNA_ORIENTATION=+
MESMSSIPVIHVGKVSAPVDVRSKQLAPEECRVSMITSPTNFPIQVISSPGDVSPMQLSKTPNEQSRRRRNCSVSFDDWTPEVRATAHITDLKSSLSKRASENHLAECASVSTVSNWKISELDMAEATQGEDFQVHVLDDGENSEGADEQENLISEKAMESFKQRLKSVDSFVALNTSFSSAVDEESCPHMI